ncbi:UPAR/Ly6 domain-containing protein crim [Planococcus citri]|uniref:UPAR/Ly6 domain-containing protein crim n=1 Tax=Planococcus citri TaxID=170843 RepID=UPI0031F9D264
MLKLFIAFLILTKYSADAIWCYQCVSTHPGCGNPFKWVWYKTVTCHDENDECVKVIEVKDGQETITRDCLSSLRGIRTDLPADRYEGCRPATVDVKLANYVNTSIKEIDIKRDYYDSTTFCFCYFDNWCNSGSHVSVSVLTLLSIGVAHILRQL